MSSENEFVFKLEFEAPPGGAQPEPPPPPPVRARPELAPSGAPLPAYDRFILSRDEGVFTSQQPAVPQSAAPSGGLAPSGSPPSAANEAAANNRIEPIESARERPMAERREPALERPLERPLAEPIEPARERPMAAEPRELALERPALERPMAGVAADRPTMAPSAGVTEAGVANSARPGAAAASGGAEAGAAGGAAAEAGGAAGMAGMAGAAGGAIGAVAAIGGVIKDGAEAWTRAVHHMEKEGEQLAKGNNFAAVADAASVAAEGLGKISGPAGAVATAMVETAKAGGALVEAFVDRGMQLSRFSGELTEARVNSGVRGLEGDIKEAQELGPAIAELIDAQSKASDELREILLPIKKYIVEELADVMASMAEWMQNSAGSLKLIGEFIVKFIDIGLHVVYYLSPLPAIAAIIELLPFNTADANDKAARRRESEKNGIPVQQLWALNNQVPGAGRAPAGRLAELMDRLRDPGVNRNAAVGFGIGDDAGRMGGGVGGSF